MDFRSLRVSKATFGDLQLLCDLSTGSPRPLHPPAFRDIASTAVHSLAHPGIWATKRLIDICALNLDHQFSLRMVPADVAPGLLASPHHCFTIKQRACWRVLAGSSKGDLCTCTAGSDVIQHLHSQSFLCCSPRTAKPAEECFGATASSLS